MFRALSHLTLAVAAAVAVAGGPVVGAVAAAPFAALNAPPVVRAIQPLLNPFEVEIERALGEANREFDTIVLAHAGGLAKDGCHRHKAVGERHWHKKSSRERGGPCVPDPFRAGGKTYKLDGNRLCTRERIALARDEVDGWGVA